MTEGPAVDVYWAWCCASSSNF